MLDVSRSMLYRLRKDDASQVIGSEKEQYRLLWSYCEEIMKRHPGSTCIIYKIFRGSFFNFPKTLHICHDPIEEGFSRGMQTFYRF